MGKFALIIGNSEYEDPNLARLTAPGEDVNDLAAVLRAPAIGGFDQVTTLVNELSATIRRAIARFFALKTADDLLLLYFSGHGVLDDRGELFLATKDTERDLVRGTAIPASYITGEMDGSRSRRQVLVLDCCHSGAFTRGSKGVVGASVGTASAFEGTGYGRVVLTATDATQFAWEGDRVIGQAENSLFTHYLIQGLQTGEADIDADGRITLDNLYDYVYGQVVKATPKQTPGKWSYKQQGDIVIASNPKPVIKPAELPRELRDAIESPFAGVREGAVRELDRLLHGSQPGLALAALDALKQLTEDDSNRVKNAALGVVNAYEEAKSAKERTLAQGEQERIAREQADAARLERERAEQARLAKEDAERERVAREKAEHERIAKEKAESERVEREKAQAARLAREKVEQEQLAKESAERERVAREKREQAESLTVAPVAMPERKGMGAGILQNSRLLLGIVAGIVALLVCGVVIIAVALNALAPKPSATPVLALLPNAAGSTKTAADGSLMMFVPAGEFTMGSSAADTSNPNEKPQHPVYLDAFWIGKYEVTNALYKKCVDAGRCTAPDISYWPKGTIPSGKENHPVVGVGWDDAVAYAQWMGGRLPTEAEWEKAACWDEARKDKRVYPWGNEFDPQKANTFESGIRDTTPVDRYPSGASAYGVLDMAGNVWEWVADWYDGGYYGNSPARNPTGPVSGQVRVLRGGSWSGNQGLARCAFRSGITPVARINYVGFRVAQSSP
jgi:formylglycine-generating enzyme required for sulfatase activity